MTINHSYKDLLASTAVFAEMANKNVDLKLILIEFILSTYSLEKTFSQTANDISRALSTHYEFDIPDAVIRTILKKLKNDGTLKQEEGKYTISTEERKKWEEFIGKVESKESEQKLISDQLISYVEFQKGKLDDNSTSDLLNCFSSYLFDESFEDEYSDLVSAFIIKNSKEANFTKELNLIREGITILKGIKYNPEINEVKPWRKELTIYLDTEHLFNICGYNGEIYKELVSDLMELIKQINNEHLKKNKEKAIRFKYLEETENEIKSFFFAARKILSGEGNRGNSSVAMDTILNGSSTASDVIRKETEFFRNLQTQGITKQEPIELYADHRFNIEDSSLYEKYASECDEDVISAILKSFTAINIQRKGNNNNSFENIGHIIMTGSWIKLRLSSDMDTKINDGDFSFATHIYYITQRLWFRLNRGLGFNSQLPSSLDVVTKAQMLLSTHLNSSVRDRYNKLEKEVESGSKSVESVQDYYISLRSNVAKPEDIIPENVEERVKFLYEEKDIESFQEEQSVLRKKAEAFDKFEREKEEKKKSDKIAKRENNISTCKDMKNSSQSAYNLYIKASITLLIIVGCIIIWGIYALVSVNDTPLGIISFVLAVISILSLVKRKWFQTQLKLVTFKKFEEYKSTHSITEADLSK